MTEHSQADPAIRVTLMPRDTNVHGTIFGGVILSYIDQAGAILARSYSPALVVTVAMTEVEFKEPVYVGDVVSFYCTVLSTGNTSIRVRVEVQAERYRPAGQVVNVTSAEVVYVAVDEHGGKLPIERERGGGNGRDRQA